MNHHPTRGRREQTGRHNADRPRRPVCRRRSPARIVLALTVLAGLAGGCAPQEPLRAAREPLAETAAARRPAALPDLSRLTASVQRQVRERHEAVGALLDTEGTPDEALGGAYGELGLILMAAQYEATAFDCLLTAQTLAPLDPRWPYYLGRFHLRRGEHAEALPFLERARALQPADLPTLVALGDTYLDHGRLADAQRAFGDALASDRRSSAALAGLGRAALTLGDPARAADYLQQALVTDPQATSLHYPLALAHRRLGSLAEADAHLRQRGWGNPTLPDPLMEAYEGTLETALANQRRALHALGAGNFTEAVALARKGLALEPDNVALGHTLGTALSQTGEVDAAIAQFEEILHRAPRYARAHYSLGIILASRGRHGEAADRLAAAIAAEPDFVEARLRLAELLQGLGRRDEALRQYSRVVEIDPRRVDAWIAGANVQFGLGRYEAARDWLVAGRKVDPEQPGIVLLETVEALLAVRRSLR